MRNCGTRGNLPQRQLRHGESRWRAVGGPRPGRPAWDAAAAVCWHAARTGLWRSGELNMRGERRPGHAGPLAAWERLAIAAILGIMVAVAIGLAVS
jgi:hypothetical protein